MTIRPRRQVTVPVQLLEKWGLDEGDALVWTILDKEANVKPKKMSVDALLDRIQKAFQESGIPESEFQEAVIRDRKERAKKIKWI